MSLLFSAAFALSLSGAFSERFQESSLATWSSICARANEALMINAMPPLREKDATAVTNSQKGDVIWVTFVLGEHTQCRCETKVVSTAPSGLIALAGKDEQIIDGKKHHIRVSGSVASESISLAREVESNDVANLKIDIIECGVKP